MAVPPSTITSRPTYLALQPGAGPGRHWLVLQADSLSAELQTELAQAFAPVAGRLHVWWVGAAASAVASVPEQAARRTGLESAMVLPDRAAVPGLVPLTKLPAQPEPVPQPGLLSLADVVPLPDLAALTQALAQQPVLVSDRLYVLGTEPFLWSVAQAATQAGWTAEQWQLSHAGSLQRRVWCTHCHGITEGVTTSIVACAGCGRQLLVRDHFSKRHGAFMGVMVDAEVPGVVPQAEEIFP
jgi:hypothetical protein